MRLRPLLAFLVPVGLVLVAPACGGGTESAADANVSDAAAADARSDRAAPPRDGGSDSTHPGPLSCEAGTTTTSDGGACDGSRLRMQNRAADLGCFGLGQFCDLVFLSVAATDRDKLPPGFSCGIELGIATCQYALTNHTVDATALDALCAALATFPDSEASCTILE
jgi:hypothetical protein